MRTRVLFIILAISLASASDLLAQQYAPLPTLIGVGPDQLNDPGQNQPGDNHGSLGRQYILIKVNDALQLITRGNPPGYSSPVLDSTFWNTSQALPSGATSFSDNGDGRVVYDPYEPSGCPTGHWMITEMGWMNYPTYSQAGVFIAVSTGENPDPTKPTNFHYYWSDYGYEEPPGKACNGNASGCWVDFLQVGFRTQTGLLSRVRISDRLRRLP